MNILELVLVLLATFGGIAVIVLPALWFHYRDESQKRESVHAERMRSLELGIPLPDAQVAQSTTLCWIGAGVPLGALGAALFATWLLRGQSDSPPGAGSLAAVWISCGAVGVVALSVTLARLRPANTLQSGVNGASPRPEVSVVGPTRAFGSPSGSAQGVVEGPPFARGMKGNRPDVLAEPGAPADLPRN
jgi:hypothetical protein